MPSPLKSLPDDPAKLKTLLLEERSTNTQLKQQIHALLEALRLEKHRLYGKSSEKCPDQSELFDEADSLVDELNGVDEEPAPATLAKKTQRPEQKQGQV